MIGTIWHFAYEWSGNNFILGFFFPINESTWEHMKLCFFPMLLYSFCMNHKLRHNYPYVTSALLSGILLGSFFIPVIFYTYSGILGTHFLFFDILTFIASVLLAFTAVYRLTLSGRAAPFATLLKLLVVLVLLFFFLFTYHPLPVGIFIAPAG